LLTSSFHFQLKRPENKKMRLMISVVSAAEAREAISGGTEILDIKNPAEGSLGAQPPHVIREIKNLAAEKIEVSAAIGDMPNLPGTAALAALGAATCGADYVKVGLHGPRNEADALLLLREVQQSVREFKTSVIAAAYADFKRAGTLDPACLPGLAAEAGIQGCLLDTAVKDGYTLFDFLDVRTLRSLAEQAHAAGLLFAIAGALREQDLPLARDLGVDVVGLRTAACRDSRRSGPLDVARVRRLHRILVPAV
jgi:(5-formylfuran-3-yl)methyl phosphate synthase